MHAIRNTVMLSAALLFTSALLPARAAPLPVGTVLTIDSGVNDATSPACFTGSCFTVDILNTIGNRHYYNFVAGSDGGIVIGKNQAAGVSPEPGELAGFIRVDAVEAPGSMYTTPYQFDPTDASVNIFDDQSCNSASACAGKTVLGTWNKSGGFGRADALGTASRVCDPLRCPGVTRWTITAAGAPGLDGDRYTLEYERNVPDFLDSFDHLFRFHLEGTIQLPKVDGVDVAVSLAAAPNPATQNAVLTYTATVSNFGTQTAAGVSLSDALPLGANFVSAVASQGSCNGTAVVTCALGDLASGASATVQIVVTPTVTGTLSNSVSVMGLDVDVNTVNNSTSASVVVNAPVVAADLSVTLTGSPNPVKRLSNLTYTINVANNGPGSAEQVTLKDTLPLFMSVVSASSSQGTCSGSFTVTCKLGAMASGANATVTLVVRPQLRGTYTNRVSVSTLSSDSNLVNNSASVKTTVK